MRDFSPQNARVMSYINLHGKASVRDLFLYCRVNSPRKRISELVDAGVPIGSYWDESEDEFGIKHRFKRYYIKGENNG